MATYSLGTEMSNQVTFLYKKALGVWNTLLTGEYYSEPKVSSRWTIYTTQTFQQYIPIPAPTDWALNVVTDKSVLYKCNSISYPYIAKYSVVTSIVTPITGSNAYTSPYMLNAISEEIDTSYSYSLYVTSNGNSNVLSPFSVAETTGNWSVDPDAGLLSFANLAGYTPTQQWYIGKTTPPVLNFFRYEGVVGPNTFQNVVQF